MNITEIALKNRLSTFVLMFIVIVLGFQSYIKLPKESSPDIKIPYIIVSTPYFGVSPEDMENLVTRPIERKLKGLADVKEIRSTSQESYSTVVIEFVAGTDVDNALQKVREKVDLAKPDLPKDAEDPVLSEINFSDLPIMILNISGKMGLVGLKQIAEDLKDEIETIPGVLNVNITGGLTREVQVNVDPQRLRYYNLGVEDVIEAVQNEHLNTPGGSIDLGTTKYLVRVPGEFVVPENMKNIVVKVEGGRPIFMRDLAQVIYSFKERDSISRLNGEETVSLAITKRSGSNLIEIADRVKAQIETMKQKVPVGVEMSITGDQSTDIRKMVKELENNIISGLVLVVLVLLVVMGTRNAFLVGTAIPLSMLLTFLVLRIMGETMNMVVLFSLILAVGMLVDNAIVIVENIYRHHQEGKTIPQAALAATNEVAIPVATSTLTTVVAFAPLLFWPGIVGEFMYYLPLTVIISLTASLFVALVFNPAICSRFMKPSQQHRVIEASEQNLGMVLRSYLRFLRAAMKRPLLTFSASVGLLIAVAMLYGVFGHGVEFFPDTDPNKVYVDVNAPSGTNLETSDKMVRQVEQVVKVLPDVKNCVANVGSQGSDMNFSFGGGTPNKSRVMVDMADFDDRSQSSRLTRDQLREKLTGITGADIEVNQEENGPPTGDPINIEIAGDDYQVLGRLAGAIREQIRGVAGVVDIKDDYDAALPEIRVTVDREKAALLGLNTRDVAMTVRTAVNGTEASKYRIGEDEYDITVRYAKDSRASVEDLQRVNVFHEGEQIPLPNIARIESSSGVGTIQHKDLKRVVTVSAKVDGRNENTALHECMDKLAKYNLPTGYFIEFTGQNEEQNESQEFLTQTFFVALFLIALVLISQFNSLILPLIIMFSVILSLIGVLIGLMVTGTSFGIIMTGLGVISLAGVVVNNAIVLIDYIQQLRHRGLEKVDAVITAGLVRFRPVMLTAITTVLGLVPLATGIGFNFIDFKWEIGGESSQWWGPMAIAVIFGLTFATLLTLVYVPVMYKLLTDFTDRLGFKPAYLRKFEYDLVPETEIKN